MKEQTIKYFKAHHSDDLLNASEEAYLIWYKEEFKKDDNDETKLRLLSFLKEKCFFTDKDLYNLLAMKVLCVWTKKADLYYDSKRSHELRYMLESFKDNDFGSIHLSINIDLKPNLPETVEEYVNEQSQQLMKYFTEVVVFE
jgi:hypothetical protein